MSGLEVCERVRAQSNMPIIVLSVKDTEHDKVQVLDLGADDYLAKPFSMGELLARLRVAVRHAAEAKNGSIEATYVLDSLRVVVHLAVQGRTTGVVIDTSVGVDEAGNAALTVPVLVVGSARPSLALGRGEAVPIIGGGIVRADPSYFIAIFAFMFG